VQVGAFQTRAEADRLATRLRGDGLEARVVGTARPFRVHVGRYAARADADAMARRLTARGITNFVTTIPPEAR
jgi:cell division protein FtsN